MTNAISFNPDRQYNIKENTDASGKKWNIHKTRQQGLYYARYEGFQEGNILPQGLEGRFTKPELCQKSINTYLTLSWDESEKAQVKAQRAKQAAIEVAEEAARIAALPVIEPVLPVDGSDATDVFTAAVEQGEPTAEEFIALAEADAPAVDPKVAIQAAVDAENAAAESAPVAEKAPKPKAKPKAKPKGK